MIINSVQSLQLQSDIVASFMLYLTRFICWMITVKSKKFFPKGNFLALILQIGLQQ